MTDLYAILELTRSATTDEITRAYRRLSRTHHPDKGGDTSAFQQLQDAYETLSDPERRAHYDRTGEIQSPATEAARIVSIIAEAYAHVLESILADPGHPSPANFSPVAKIKDYLRAAISKLRDARLRPEAAVRLLTAISGRFTAPTDDNILESLTAEQLAHSTSALADLDGKIALLESAIERLAEFGYDWTPAPNSRPGLGLIQLDLTNNESWRKLWKEQTEKHRVKED
jgi:curved DNA-binding protein CbpA